jgi:hypothetical protein
MDGIDPATLLEWRVIPLQQKTCRSAAATLITNHCWFLVIVLSNVFGVCRPCLASMATPRILLGSGRLYNCRWATVRLKTLVELVGGGGRKLIETGQRTCLVPSAHCAIVNEVYLLVSNANARCADRRLATVGGVVVWRDVLAWLCSPRVTRA